MSDSALPKKNARRRQKPGALPPLSPPGLEVGLNEHEREQLVEVLDNRGQPLLCLPPSTALRQGLPVRVVAVALRTRRNRLILHKRSDARLGFDGRWDLYAGFMLVGEAREDAALRLLSGAGLDGLRVSLLSDRKEPDDPTALFALFAAELPAGLRPAHPEVLEVDADELAGLIRDVPELLTPELVRAAAVPGLLRLPEG